MTERPSISTLLSQVLIAFTIEFDNEWERQLLASSPRRVFLVSLALWAAVMRFVREDGMLVRELGVLAGLDEPALRSRLNGFVRWGYLRVEPHADDERATPPWRDWNVRLTRAGKLGRDVWQPLFPVIEKRWRERFGANEIDTLRARLEALIGRYDAELPDYLPVVTNLYAGVVPFEPRLRIRSEAASRAPLPLPALLSKALLAFTRDFERESVVALPLGANVLRVVTASGVQRRDLPALTGVSKEAVAMSLGPLQQHGLVLVESDPRGARTKQVRLTEEGLRVRKTFARRFAVVEKHWRSRFGDDVVDDLRASLHALVIARDGASYRMSAGLVPPDGCWRARKPYLSQTLAVVRDPAAALPQYPMVLHRGGWPDGS